jgi:hypothetical protein
MTEFYKLIRDANPKFDALYTETDQPDPTKLLREVRQEISVWAGNRQVWTPDMDEDTYDLREIDTWPEAKRRVTVVQVVHGRVFIERMDVVTLDGELYVDVEKIG